MKTEILRCSSPERDWAAIVRAAQVIRAGGLVAFPTETVYGLGANALDAEAVARIYRAKRRPPEDPCIVHIAAVADLPRVAAVIPPAVERLARFWPGPLSVILPRAEAIPPIVTAGRPTVAVRIPAHPVALALIREAGVPIAAPSANRFMHTSPTTAQHVWDDLAGEIDLILDGGPTPVGVESTVLDLTGDVPTVLRPGAVTVEQLRAVLGEVRVQEHVPAAAALPSPGLFERHYAPEAEVLLFEGPRPATLAAMRAKAEELARSGVPTGILATEEDLREGELDLPGVEVAIIGCEAEPESIARGLYAGLRALERAGVRVIIARTTPETGIGRAVRDRLIRAAGGRVVRLAP